MSATAAAAERPARSASPLAQTLAVLLLGAAPALLVAAFTLGVVHDRYAFDFHTFWGAGRDVLHGVSPYPDAAAVGHARPADGAYEYFVYPPPFVLALLPAAALPFAVAAAIWTLLLLASVAGALALLDVRDWRCYGVAFASLPTLSCLRLGAVTPLLLLLAAAAWRYRDRWGVAGAAVGAAVVLKLFLWPLAGWLLLTRRWKAAAVASVGAAALTLGAWAAIGYDGLGAYPSLLRAVSRHEAPQSYSLVAVADRLGLAHPQVSWLALAAPILAVLLALCLRDGREDASYGTAIVAALLLSPIVWLHYFVLLLVPLAARSRSLGPLWLLPLAFWMSPFTTPAAQPLWRLVAVLGVAVLVATPRLRPRARLAA